MASEVKANKISPATGTALQISDSGDTTTIPSGATLDVSSATMTGFTIPSGQTLTVASGATIANSGTATGFGGDNTPSFQARNTSTQTGMTSDVYTKVQFNTEDWDTDSAYDNTTNYRFTVPVGGAGKYQLYSQVYVMSSGVGNLQQQKSFFYLNGSASNYGSVGDWRNGSAFTMNVCQSAIMDLADGDYMEVFVTINTASGTFDFDNNRGYFSGYKLIGV